MIGDRHRIVHPAARVIAQVKHKTLRTLLHHALQCRLKLRGAVARELIQVDIAHFVGKHAAFHPVDRHGLAFHFKGDLLAVALHNYRHLRAGRAAHDVHRIVERVDIHIEVFHLAQNVAAMHARRLCGTAVKHAADGADARRVGAGNLHTHACVAALVVLPQLSVFLRGVVERIGIAEAQQQTLRRAVQHGLFVRLLIVILIDLLLQLNQGIILLVLLIKLLGDRYRVSVFGLRHLTG